MNTPPIVEHTPRKPSGFDPGLKCLAAVFIFVVVVRVLLTLANKTGSREIVGIGLIGAFFGLIALIVTSCVVWSRRATSPRPARRWALMIAITWAFLQLLVCLLIMLQMLPRALSETDRPATEINRKTFSMTLPGNWIEDTKRDTYDPDSLVFFDGPESALFSVIVGQKSAGSSVDTMLDNQRDYYKARIVNATITPITKWSNFDGKGFQMEGKVQGIANGRITVFGFEKGDNVCIVEEYATPGDYKTYARDFEKIRQTFRLHD
ncbi:MAG: hypothetical protein ABSF10_14555 [Verrucomicrobiota bacterium]|jgi:hypothetical protein